MEDLEVERLALKLHNAFVLPAKLAITIPSFFFFFFLPWIKVVVLSAMPMHLLIRL